MNLMYLFDIVYCIKYVLTIRLFTSTAVKRLRNTDIALYARTLTEAE